MNATVEHANSGYVIRFERRLRHPIDAVWQALTVPEKVREWLAELDLDLEPGGRFALRFSNTGFVMNGYVTDVDPPRVLAHTWSGEETGDGEVRWELRPEADGTCLDLTHTLSACDELPTILAGWETHLDLLESALAGEPAEWPWERWRERRDAHERSLGGRVDATAG